MKPNLLSNIKTLSTSCPTTLRFRIVENQGIPRTFQCWVDMQPRPNPTNTPRVCHAERTWKWPLPCRFNVEYMWCVCKVLYIYLQMDVPQDLMHTTSHYFYSELQSNVPMADMLYNGQLLIGDTFFRNLPNHCQTVIEKS